MSDLTRPERAAQIRQAKRYRAAINREGICSACKFREQTFEVWHCKGREERRHTPPSVPVCERDGKLPRFEFDDSVLERFRDAA